MLVGDHPTSLETSLGIKPGHRPRDFAASKGPFIVHIAV